MLQYYLKKIILSLSGVFITLAVVSQTDRYSVENLSLESGLSESSVRSVIQDSHGYLWVGSLDGLNRYNGYGFDVYRHNPKDTSSIADNSINAVFEDSKGNIWVGTQFGLSRFNRKKENFSNFYHVDSLHYSLSSNNVFDIYEDHQGNIWVLTSQSIDRYVPEKNHFQHYEYTSSNYAKIGTYYFFDIVQGPNGLLWFGSYKGLYAFDPDNETFKEYNSEKYPGFSSAFVKSIYLTDKGRFLLGTQSGLIHFDPGKETFKTILPSEQGYSKEYDLINAVFKADENRYGIGSDGGILFYDVNTGRFSKGYYKLNEEWRQFRVSSSATDHSNIIWLGTFQNGLLKISPNRKKFYLIDRSNYPQLSDASIASVYQENDHTLWVGTWGSGLNILDTKNKESYIVQSEDKRYGFNRDYIHAITKDSKNRIWLGTRKGPGIFDKENEKFYPLSSRKLDYGVADLSNARVFSITEDSQKRLWFATDQGVYFFRNDSLNNFLLPDSLGIETSLVYNVYESKGNNLLWIGTDYGLLKLDVKSLEILNFFKAGRCNSCLSSSSVLSMRETNDTTLWAGTKAGLNRIHQLNDSITYYIQANTNFSNDNIYNILEDSRENLWLSTNHGLIKFNPFTEAATNYVRSDGLQGYEFNYGAYHKTEDGKLFFGGVSGLNYFYPDSIRKNSNKPRLVFNKVEKYLKNKTVTQSIFDGDKLVISSNVYGFTIDFFALEYTHPDNNQYRYKMTGITEGWRDLGTKHSVSFSRLSPGTYEFMFVGSNNDQIWNKEPKTIEIVVRSSILKSIYAYILYGIVAILLLMWILRFRTQKLRESNQALKERQKAHLKIQNQKEELAGKNKNITDSINYARRIIEAMMPTEKAFKKILPDSFVLSIPKDIVSGDFYWIAEKNDKIFVAAVDCTGHGIPGAFMSIIGFDLLRNIIEIEGVDEPAEILNRLDEGVAQTFIGAEDMELSDGMDLSFCVIDKRMHYLEFAGAMNPLYLIRDNNVLEFSGDRFSVGNKEIGSNKHFRNQRIPLKESDVIYLFSDGFPDQFGGPKGKKFKYRRFRHLLLTIHKLPFDKQKAMLLKSIQKWKGNLEQVDDILLIGAQPLRNIKQ